MLVHTIKKEWSKYVVKACSGKSDCSICATKNAHSVVLDCDRVKLDDAFNEINAKYGKSSDCLLIEHDGSLNVAVVEFKSDWSDATGAAEQVLAGCRIAKILLSRYKLRKRPKIYLIVSATRCPEAVRKKFLSEIKKSKEDVEDAFTAGCHDEFINLRNRKRNLNL